jgi:hypothetical protein
MKMKSLRIALLVVLAALFGPTGSLISQNCDTNPSFGCSEISQSICAGRCSDNGGCSGVSFWNGSCQWGSYCNQNFVLYCEDGTQTVYDECRTFGWGCMI